MQLLVFTVAALAVMVLSYAFGQGGPIAGLLFFAILFVGATVRITKPLRDKLKP